MFKKGIFKFFLFFNISMIVEFFYFDKFLKDHLIQQYIKYSLFVYMYIFIMIIFWLINLLYLIMFRFLLAFAVIMKRLCKYILKKIYRVFCFLKYIKLMINKFFKKLKKRIILEFKIFWDIFPVFWDEVEDAWQCILDIDLYRAVRAFNVGVVIVYKYYNLHTYVAEFWDDCLYFLDNFPVFVEIFIFLLNFFIEFFKTILYIIWNFIWYGCKFFVLNFSEDPLRVKQTKQYYVFS